MKNGLVIEVNGAKCWYLNGKFHRTDGPAIEDADGDKFWWINGKYYFESEWKKEVRKLKLQQICST